MKKKYFKYLLLIFSMLIVLNVSGQSIKSVRINEIQVHNANGVVLTITSIFIVVIALIVLFLFFKQRGNFHVNSAQKKKTEQNLSTEVVTRKKRGSVLTNEELAAISIALYKYSQDLHDIETKVLTINRTAKVYSPWSSKIHSLTQTPIRK